MTGNIRYGILLLLIFLLVSPAGAQYRSWSGSGLSPYQTYRCLNLYIDIIYDVTKDPENADKAWKPGIQEGVNMNIPPFAGKYLLPDTVNIARARGSLSKRFNEASFGHFNLLGESVSVTLRQSHLSESGRFTWRQALARAVLLLNEQGGLTGNSLHGRELLSDFSNDGDDRIDIINIMFRNTSKVGGNLPSGGMSGGYLHVGLLVEGKTTHANSYTAQLLGSDDVLRGNSTILDHELGHKLFGGNEFHATGGNHWSTYSVCTFMGIQSGYGIMGGGGSSLVCTNAYERWRMHWTSPQYNPGKVFIQASGNAADLTQQQGEQTFYLRDFITTGDAIRIQLPYKDHENSSNQYLWIENHQIGRNRKEDFYMFADRECKDAGVPGVFMYLQVGKDVLEADQRSKVWPSNETDNLKMLCAGGSYDFEYRGKGTDCMRWGHNNRKVFRYGEANPLSGQNDQSASFNTSEAKVLSNKTESGVWIKELPDGEVAPGWPRHGENSAVFQDGAVVNLSSNPVPVNAVTTYVRQGGGKIKPVDTDRNTRHIYLTGLRIELSEDGISEFGDSCRIFKVKLRWDDYQLTRDSRYTGAIRVKELLEIEPNVSLRLNQSKVPTQVERDPESGEFTSSTVLHLEPGGRLHLKKNSTVRLEEGATLHIDSGAMLTLDKKAEIWVKRGTVLRVSANAKLDFHRRASIVLEPGAELHMSTGQREKLNSRILNLRSNP